MRIRVLPSEVQARTFELLGAVPLRWDLTEAIAAIKAGTIDAQENPFANTVTYGVHEFHRFHTITNHFYISRPIFFHRPAFDAWPQDVQHAMRDAVNRAVAFQRELAIEEDREARAAIEAEGCEITALTPKEHAPSALPSRRCSKEARANLRAARCSIWLRRPLTRVASRDARPARRGSATRRPCISTAAYRPPRCPSW